MNEKQVTEFVEVHTDEQCGLEVANVSVWNDRIIVSAKNRHQDKSKKIGNMKGMRSEWLAQAKDLIDELRRDPRAGYRGLGLTFTIHAISDTHFELRRG